MDRALERIVATPTGRALAEEFVAQGGSVTVKVQTRDLLSPAETDVWHGSPELRIDPDPRYKGYRFTWILAHELLGHCLRDFEARKAGAEMAYSFYEGNEYEASLTGWVISAEAGDPPGEAVELYLKRPAKFLQEMELTAPLYTGALPLRQLADPVPGLKERRQRLDRGLASFDRYLKRPLQAREREDTLRHQARVRQTAQWLDKLIGHFSSAQGAPQLNKIRRGLSSAAGRRFFAQAEARIQNLQKRLQELHSK